MANEWLFWLTGVVLVIVGMLTAVYLVYMQLRRGATGHSILSTSDALALVVIGVMFIINRMNVTSFNTELKLYSETLAIKRQFGNSLNEECSYRKVLLGYALFLVPFLNAFVSMIAQTSECYFNIKSRASQEKKSSGSMSTNVANTKTINVQEAKNQSRGKSLEQLRVPTLISEMDLVVNKVSCVSSDSVLDCHPSTSSGVKDPANIFLIPESKTPSEVDDKEFKTIITVPTTGDEHDKPALGQPNMVVKSVRNLRSIKRLGLSIFGQWAIPLLGISVFLLSNMDEHSMDAVTPRDSGETICYVDNTLASGLKVSQECLENAYQEAYIKSLIGQHEKHDTNKLDMIRQYAATKNDTEIDHMTSMIINKIYDHVDEFNKTEQKEQYAFKNSDFQVPIVRKQRQASVSSFLKNLPKKNGTTAPAIKPKLPAPSISRFNTKPSYKSDHPRRKNPSNQTRLENREGVDKANLDNDGDEAVYYDELPVDYVQPTGANSAEETDDKNHAGAASTEDNSKSEELETVGESDALRDGIGVNTDAADNEQDNQPQKDSSSYENSTPPDNDHSNLTPESVTLNPGATTPIKTTFAPENTTPQSEDIEDVTEEQFEEQIEDINANVATSLPNFVTSTQATEPPIVSSLPSPSSGENTDPMKDVNICIKSCIISNNFLKGYLFVLLFVGYFLPITVAVVMYIVTLKNINSIEPQHTGSKQDAVLDVNGKEICSSMECIAKIVKQFILVNIVMWTPTFLESLLRTWFCVNSPEWVVLFLFFLGQAHGIIRNMLNVKLVQTDSRGQTIGQSLWLGSHRKNDGTIHPTLPVPAESESKSDQDKLFVKSRIVTKLFKLDKK